MAILDPSVIHLGNVWVNESIPIEPQFVKLLKIDCLNQPEMILGVDIEREESRCAMDVIVEPVDQEVREGLRLKITLKPKLSAVLGSFSDKVIV